MSHEAQSAPDMSTPEKLPPTPDGLVGSGDLFGLWGEASPVTKSPRATPESIAAVKAWNDAHPGAREDASDDRSF
jgi:hypothetical protein